MVRKDKGIASAAQKFKVLLSAKVTTFSMSEENKYKLLETACTAIFLSLDDKFLIQFLKKKSIATLKREHFYMRKSLANQMLSKSILANWHQEDNTINFFTHCSSKK